MSVWMCPGQGAQKPGMGADLLVIPEVARVFDTMSSILGIDLGALAQDGTPEQVNQTEAAQALTMAVAVGVGEALYARGFAPSALVGFSLGQMSALVLSRALTLEDATALLQVRSAAMARECANNPGGMMALMGATLEDAQVLCEESAEGDVLVCANHNAPGQIVVSGTEEALARAETAWKEAGRKAKRLATQGAFHSPLMAGAAADVEEFCKTLDFAEPTVTLICNTDAQPFVISEAAARMGSHVTSGVMFQQSIQALIDAGETEFIETGFGGVLCNLVKRIDPAVERTKIGTLEAFEDYVSA